MSTNADEQPTDGEAISYIIGLVLLIIIGAAVLGLATRVFIAVAGL